MSTWTYETEKCTFVLEDKSIATYEGVEDTDAALREIDEAVHRLHEVIQQAEKDIYKLRKLQRVLKKGENNE